ncbi:hypothetical protein KR018_012042, partial [Drosophila ironensis]
ILMYSSAFLNRSREYVRRWGLLQRVWVFNRLLIMSADAEFNEQLLSSQEHLVKHPVYRLLGQWLGNGLLLSDGKVWHQRRKIITPTFHFSILEQFVEVFDQQSNVCVQNLAPKANGEVFDVYRHICLAALDIIAETAMGTKICAQSNESTPYAEAVNECTALMCWRFMSVYLQSEFLFTLTHPHLKWRQTQLIRTMHEFTTKVIEQRRNVLEEQQRMAGGSTGASDVGAKQRMALLDVLLMATMDGRPLSNDEIREEVDTFMFEGHDTTTSALSFCLHELSRHPEVQDRLLEEIDRVLGSDRSRPVTIRDLNELKYMESVIKESLRMYPPVPIVGRKLVADFKYSMYLVETQYIILEVFIEILLLAHKQFGEAIIPAGSEIIVGIFGIHRIPEDYPEPDEFNPDRFENGDRVAPFKMVPFSAGPRNCIGQKFALLEMKMMLAKIVREYELLPLGAPVECIVNIVLRSSTGFQLGMRKRNPS